jgi:hypothetical protein
MMVMKTITKLVTAAAVLSTVLPTTRLQAQDQATTLLALSQRAGSIVVATVTAATDPSPDWHRLELRVDRTLKGPAVPSVTLLEPAGACCGRSLFALAVGETRLLFLQQTGPGWHPIGGARGVLPALAPVIAHVADLLAAATPAAQARLLARTLGDAEPRLAEDAAHALAVLPELSLSATDRAALVQALADAVQRGQTRAASLAEAAARVADAALLDSVLPIYLTTPREDQSAALRRAFARCAPSLVAERLPLQPCHDRCSAVRAAELLVAMPDAASTAAMDRLLQKPLHPEAKLHLCEGLLAAGVPATRLAPMVPEVVLDLAQERQRRPRPLKNVVLR